MTPDRTRLVERIQNWLSLCFVLFGLGIMSWLIWKPASPTVSKSMAEPANEPVLAPASTPSATSTADKALRTGAEKLAGRWRLSTSVNCTAPYHIVLPTERLLIFEGPDGSQTREAILGRDGLWLHASSGTASSFYRVEGSSLIYRYGDKANIGSETRFKRCAD
jgi:hypothetical protein